MDDDETTIMVGHPTLRVSPEDSDSLRDAHADLIRDRIAQANDSIARIGMGSYQWRLFLLCGCGWFADNMWLQGVSVVIPSVRAQFGLSEAEMGVGSSFTFLGMMIGGGFWGIMSDVIGRKPAFTLTLLITTFFGFYASFATTFPQFYWRLFWLGTGVGGNLPVDGSLFLEFVPASHQHLMTLLSLFWPLGQIFTAAVAWKVLPGASCTLLGDAPCDINTENWGWRFTLRVLAGVTFAMVLGRVLCVRMLESPKFLLSVGKVKRAEEVLVELARTNGWTGNMDDLNLRHSCASSESGREHGLERATGTTASAGLRSGTESVADDDALLTGFNSASSASARSRMSSESGSERPRSLSPLRRALSPLRPNNSLKLRGNVMMAEWWENVQVGWNLLLLLFEEGVTRRTTILILAIWSLISLGYTMFNGFLPIFLAANPDASAPPISVDETFRNYFILALMGIPGSVAGMFLIDTTWGRRGTMAISTFGTAFALYLFTFSRTETFQLVCGSIVSLLQNMMYGVLYTYTPEVFESRVRGTASGAASVVSRVFGCMAPLLTGWLLGVSVALPLVIASGFLFLAGVCMVLLPVETRGRDVL
ncbi:hypothetical protein HDU77_002642 [Chytriomyces hyalinus]|nr:hypothetical protein HDU77_002642 [Chytriomyces hyalinus]